MQAVGNIFYSLDGSERLARGEAGKSDRIRFVHGVARDPATPDGGRRIEAGRLRARELRSQA